MSLLSLVDIQPLLIIFDTLKECSVSVSFFFSYKNAK